MGNRDTFTIKATDRNLVSVMTSRLKHGTSFLQGDAKWEYTAAVERILADHARLQSIAGEAENAEILTAAWEVANAFEDGRPHPRWGDALGALRRACKKVRA